MTINPNHPLFEDLQPGEHVFCVTAEDRANGSTITWLEFITGTHRLTASRFRDPLSKQADELFVRREELRKRNARGETA